MQVFLSLDKISKPVLMVLSVATMLALTACESTVLVKADCQGASDLAVICGFNNPEDLVVIPGEELMIVSEYGHNMGQEAGQLTLLDLESDNKIKLYPYDNASPVDGDGGQIWGQDDCQQVSGDQFSPHGIHLSQRNNGLLQLLVVNHGARESVEFFQLTQVDNQWSLIWRGCAVAPGDPFLNDVVALPNSEGFLVTDTGTDMISPLGAYNMFIGLLGVKIGHVLQWQKNRGFSIVAGTESSYPNGIELSSAGETIYLNEYLSNKVKKIDRLSGVLLGEVEVTRPDNITWDNNNRLLVASQTASFLKMAQCRQKLGYSCMAEFEIVSIKPETMDKKVILSRRGPPFGGATVAVRKGDQLYIGTFSGNRIGVIGGQS